MIKSVKEILARSREIDRGFGRYAEKFSCFIWPWREKWLMATVGLLAVLDFTSTYILLELNYRYGLYESGLLAIWALDRGGFPLLLIVDIISALILSLVALTTRYIYCKRGYKGYGRAAFILLLTPYIIMASIAIVNNIILLFR